MFRYKKYLKYPHLEKETPGGEALDASEDKEKSLLDWLKDILAHLSKCEKALNLFMENKEQIFQDFVSCLTLIF